MVCDPPTQYMRQPVGRTVLNGERYHGRMGLRWVFVVLLLHACDGARDVRDAGDDAPAEEGFFDRQVTHDDGQIVIEKVAYRSGGLRIFAQVCRPMRAGRFPLVVNNHGGFQGIGAEWNGGPCSDQAKQGFVAVQSAYRGEDGSEGEVEVCHGEVDDVLALLAIARKEPYVDTERIVMLGASHGGCITLRAIARGGAVDAAVALVPPTDFAAAHAFWSAGLAAGNGTPLQNATWTMLLDQLERATGGTPSERPDAYRERSPLWATQELATAAPPLLVVGGVDDWLVPPAQICALMAREPMFQAYHVAAGGTVVQSVPAGCEANSTIGWREGPRPLSWPGKRYALVYDATGHGLEGDAGRIAIQDALLFLLPYLTP